MRGEAPNDLAQVAQEAAAESVRNPPAASAAVAAKIAKKVVQERERDLEGDNAKAKAIAKRGKAVSRAITLEPRDLDDLDPARQPGICLVRSQDNGARRKAQKCKFKVVSDPVDFVAESAKVPACVGKGHLVILPTSEATDYSQSARIAAAIMGGFCATPRDYEKMEKESPERGIMYTQKLKGKSTFHYAVSNLLAQELPSVRAVLRAIALAPGSCFVYHESAKQIPKLHEKKIKERKTTREQKQTMFVICTASEVDTFTGKHPQLFVHPRAFVSKFDSSERARCPGV
jgi:hypothetical protein